MVAMDAMTEEILIREALMHDRTLSSHLAGDDLVTLSGESSASSAGEGPCPGSSEGRWYARSEDNAARFVVYFGPYILWGSMGVLAGLLLLFSG